MNPEKQKRKEPSACLEQPWHSAVLGNHPLPPLAVAKIFEIKAEVGWDDMTVRESVWVGRLCAMPLSLQGLKLEAAAYATHERAAELAGTPFDARALDVKALAKVRFGKGHQATTNRVRDHTPDYSAWLASYRNTHTGEDFAVFEMMPEKFAVKGMRVSWSNGNVSAEVSTPRSGKSVARLGARTPTT